MTPEPRKTEKQHADPDNFRFHGINRRRETYDVTSRDTIRPNRDTLNSSSVFDLTSPLTIGLPDPGRRYQSLMIASQNHSIWSEYGPQDAVTWSSTSGWIPSSV